MLPLSHWLPDGVGTNGVVAEVPRFPLMSYHGRMWQHVTTNMANCGNTLALKTNKCAAVAAWCAALSEKLLAGPESHEAYTCI